MDHYLPLARMITVFPQVDSLPGSQHEFAVLEGDTQLGGRQRRLDVGGHVVTALQRMGVKRVVFRHQPVQPVFQINPRAVVVIFLDQQAGGGVAYEQCAQAFALLA